ncbi:hypothetical protein CEXT_16741 [Caerostris extrusa]|uniref:Uncharacterized protein n=1 Tax=Caerostris extrusa TaxID=172846 RepID=A0AAV4S129_CAEEX|nr:hypothetical protein CEXT_16741 [Caerostris extrusa]
MVESGFPTESGNYIPPGTNHELLLYLYLRSCTSFESAKVACHVRELPFGNNYFVQQIKSERHFLTITSCRRLCGADGRKRDGWDPYV